MDNLSLGPNRAPDNTLSAWAQEETLDLWQDRPVLVPAGTCQAGYHQPESSQSVDWIGLKE